MEGTYVDDIPEHAQSDVMPAWVAENEVVEERAIAESTALTVVPQPRSRSVLAAISHAGALAWRQPAVRAAVRTGASAIAFSVALQVAGRLVAGRNARHAVTQAALPGLMDLLKPGERHAPRPRRRRGVEVTETVIFMQRTTRY